ncbi:hypothetical protein HYU18_01610 [Candidatus Woesearchaeota archaeon]|nr:hypothetical protein [Candidatus Woesearchaeota archaeon]
MDKITDVTNSELKQLSQEISYIKGWMYGINHFKGKKGQAINPIFLIIAIIIVIIVILYFQGKL